MARCSVQENISGMIRTVSEAESIVNWQQWLMYVAQAATIIIVIVV
jgi:hypothetical protein